MICVRSIQAPCTTILALIALSCVGPFAAPVAVAQEAEKAAPPAANAGEARKKEWPPNFAELLGVQPKHIEEPWLPITAGPFTTITAPLLEKDHIQVQPFFFYTWTRGAFDEDSHFHGLTRGDMKETAMESLTLKYAPLDNIELDAQLFLNEVRTRQGGRSASATGLADTLATLQYGLLHQTTAWWCPEATLLTQIKLPTGKYQHADPNLLGTDIMGTGSTDLTLGLNVTKCYRPLILHGNLWHSWPIETQVDGVPTRYGNYLQWNAGLEIPFWRDKLAYMLEFNGLHQADKRQSGVEIGGSRVNSVTLGTGIEFSLSDAVQIEVGYQRTLWGTNTDANDTFGAMLVWTFGVPPLKRP